MFTGIDGMFNTAIQFFHGQKVLLDGIIMRHCNVYGHQNRTTPMMKSRGNIGSGEFEKRSSYV